MKKIEVIGRNGDIYPAEHIKDNLYIVGAYIVEVEWDENCSRWQVEHTVCRATKVNVKKYGA